jgi:hypothetical protein
MTLTEAAFWTRRVGVIVIIAGVIFIIVAIILTSTANGPLPPEYLTANWACTETKEEFLEHKLEIPSLQVNTDSENVFEIQTDTGKVNDLSSLEIINVYKYKEQVQQLNNQLRATEIAVSLGFEPEGITRKGTTHYLWTDSSNSRSLQITAKDLNFIMTTNGEYIRNIVKENPLPAENEAISLAKNIIRRINLIGSDVNYNDIGNIKTHLIDINPNDRSYSEAPSLADAELIRVDLHKTKPMISIRNDIENFNAMVNSLDRTIGEGTVESIIVNDQKVEVYNYSTIVTYPNPSSSNISLYIGPPDPNSTKMPNLYRIEFTYWPLEKESCGTYELVSPSYAIDKVQNGEASLVYLNDKNGDEVIEYQPRSVKKYVIYTIDIAYYEDITQPSFLQPIYVISGEAIFKNDTRGEFHFFYPAINYDIVGDRILPTQTVETENGNGLYNL